MFRAQTRNAFDLNIESLYGPRRRDATLRLGEAVERAVVSSSMSQQETRPSRSAEVAAEVQDFYERYPYPRPIDSLEQYRRLGQDRQRRRAEYHFLWPVRPYREGQSILVAGCGTSQGGQTCHALARGSGDRHRLHGRIRLSPLANASGEAIKNATLEMVAPGSTIRSDGWDSYNLLTKYGYLHTPVSHAQSASGDATPLAHRVASFCLNAGGWEHIKGRSVTNTLFMI